MKKQMNAFFPGAILILGITQSGYTAGLDTRIERRHYALENTADRIGDKHHKRVVRAA